MTTQETKTKKAECSECSGQRNCSILGSYKEEFRGEYYQSDTDWYILMCRGCDNVFVQTIHTDSEGFDFTENGNAVSFETIKYWPSRSKRQKPDWMMLNGNLIENKNHLLNKAINETYTALDNDLNILAAIGIRTAFDLASDLLNIDRKLSFNAKLSQLVEKGHINSVDKKRLSILVDAGSASAHRGWEATSEDIKIMMDIFEQFILDTFSTPEKKKKLDKDILKIENKVPKRP